MKLKFTVNRERLETVKRKMLLWIGGISIVLGATVLYERHELIQGKKAALELEKNFGKNLSIVIEANSRLKDKLDKSDADAKKSEEDYKKQVLETKKNHYFDLLCEDFFFYYGQYNMKMSAELRKPIVDTVPRVFKNVEILWAKGRLKNIAPTPRLVALTILSKYPIESNFDLDCITWNYIREKGTSLPLLFMKKDKEFVEGITGLLYDGDYKMDGEGYICGVKNGQKFRVKPIGKFNKLIPADKDIAKITLDDKSTIMVTAVEFMIKTTRDWGGLQVNDGNLVGGYNELYRLGVWKQSNNKWINDPDVNILMRLIIDDSRVYCGLDKSGASNANIVILNVLKKTRGWEGIFE